MVQETTPNNFVLENTSDSIRISVHGYKRWGSFLTSLIWLVILAIFILPFVGGLLITFLIGIPTIFPKISEVAIPEALLKIAPTVILLVFGGLYLYILIPRLSTAVDALLDREIIEIDNQKIYIERSGFLGYTKRKLYLAENVKGITTLFSVPVRPKFLNNFLFGSSSGAGNLVILLTSQVRRLYRCGKDISRLDADNIVDIVYRKFPKYRKNT